MCGRGGGQGHHVSARHIALVRKLVLKHVLWNACRYAPSVEQPVFHFHKLVHADLVQ